jgi:molecular chaperone DnaK (HSP70)
MNKEQEDLETENYIDSYLNEDINNKKEDFVVGIDLGTTNSCIGIWRNNNLEIIPDENGNNTIPSFVGYTKVNKYVGLEAKNQKELNPKNVFYEFKRLIGRKINDESVINDKEFFNYDIIADEQDNVNVSTDYGLVITPEELSSIILKKLKDMASKYLKTDITKAVITVPAYFNDSQRQATKDAAKIAGLQCMRIINEPTSAALTYGLLNKSLSKKNEGDSINVIVYDLGGGTLDISLLTITDGIFEVKASVGNTHLGGADFDNKIISYCINYFKKNNNIEKLNNLSSLSYQRLKRACENAKKILSVSLKTNIVVTNFHDGKDLVINLTRDRLNTICRDLLILALKPLEDILETSELSKEDIHEIILVGGMTRMPQIVENIKKFFNGKEPNCSMNPDEVVAAGAAIQGYILSHGDDPFSDNVTLLDIIPLSLGVETIGGVMNILVPRNTIIPTTKRRLYTTDSDYETSVIIKVFEGERKMTKDNFLVGEFELEGIESAPRGLAKIEVKFNIDINGIITVTAEDITDKEKQSNKKSITITGNKGRLKQEQINKLIDEAREFDLKDKILKKKKELYYEIDDITTNVSVNLKNNEYKLNEKDREILSEDIYKYRSWLTEKKYHEREESEYKEINQELTKKFGTLILKANKSKDVDGLGMKVKATTVYGDEKEDAELNKENYDNNVEDEELGIQEMDEEEKKEIKALKNNLIELAHSIFDLLNDNEKFTNSIITEDKNKIVDFIDDTLLWSYTITKPKKIDFINKINDINEECNKLFEKYKDVINSNENLNKLEELEKLCFSLKSSINCGLFSLKKEHLDLMNNKLNYYFEQIENYKLEDYKLENDNEKKEELKNGFLLKCEEFIIELNKICKEIENELVIKEIGINSDYANEIINKDNMDGTDIEALLKGYNQDDN